MARKKTEMDLNVQTWKDCQDVLEGKASSEERDNMILFMINKKLCVCEGKIIYRKTYVSSEPTTCQVTF